MTSVLYVVQVNGTLVTGSNHENVVKLIRCKYCTGLSYINAMCHMHRNCDERWQNFNRICESEISSYCLNIAVILSL